jgi:hypothetical protein
VLRREHELSRSPYTAGIRPTVDLAAASVFR